MWKIAVAILCAALGCGPGPMARANRANVEPAIELPAPMPAAVAQPQCNLITEIAPLETYFGELPSDVSEEDAYKAALQFITVGGVTSVESQDPIAHTIITKRFNGQTWTSTCTINRYFMYALRIAIVGTRMVVHMECWESFGWEAHSSQGVSMHRNRGELKACEDNYVSKNDALLPSMTFHGSLELLALGRSRSLPAPR